MRDYWRRMRDMGWMIRDEGWGTRDEKGRTKDERWGMREEGEMWVSCIEGVQTNVLNTVFYCKKTLLLKKYVEKWHLWMDLAKNFDAKFVSHTSKYIMIIKIS